MATLMVTAYTPSESTGRGLRTVGVARALARHDDVDVAYVEFDGIRPSASLLTEPRVSLHRLEASFGVRRLVSYARARLAGTPHDYARGVSHELVTTTRSSGEYARVVADGPIVAASLLLVAPTPRVVYCAHNVESVLASTLSTTKTHARAVSRLRTFERKLMDAAGETWVPTHRDVEDASAIAPGATLRHVPNVVDVRGIAPAAQAGTGRIIFVADFSYEPNRIAAEFLVHEVLPRLWATSPEARLALVGRSLELPPELDSRVERLGFVENLAEEYARADCAVVPLLQAGGSQLKFIEALAYGLPVVATPLAGERLEGAEAGTHFIDAEGPAAFAEALGTLLNGGDLEVGRHGRAFVEANYSIEALAAILTAPIETGR